MRRASVVLTGLLAFLFAWPAAAEVVPGSGEFHIFTGYMLGDEASDPFLGATPDLDDDLVFGLRLGGSVSPHWGFEGTLEMSPNQIDNLPSFGQTDATLYFADLSAINYFNPDYKHVAYLVWGLGWAKTDIDDETFLEDQDSMTFHLGVGGDFFLTDKAMLRLEARWRYVDELTDPVGPNEGTHASLFEATVGFGWRWGGR